MLTIQRNDTINSLKRTIINAGEAIGSINFVRLQRFTIFVKLHWQPMKKSEAYREMTDSELLAAVRDGDARAFDAIFLRWYPQVYKFLLALVKEEALAKDLSQSVFMKVWLHREWLDPSKSFKNYLLVLSRNGALDVFKSKRHLIMANVQVSHEEPSPDRTDHLAEFAEAQSRLLAAVKQMPPQRRAVFEMSRFRQLSSKEIADELGLSVRTVEKHLQLALDNLRDFLS